jgi:hypothetical protein
VSGAAGSEAARFFAAYAEAFGRGDVDALCAMWAYPAYVAARGRRAALDAAGFRDNLVRLCAFYEAQGVASAEKRVVAEEALFPGLRLVRTADRLTGADGAEIAAWEHCYLLSDTSQGLRAVAAMPDGELDAWQARGTPMGSW